MNWELGDSRALLDYAVANVMGDSIKGLAAVVEVRVGFKRSL
jgi:hypothetical protein